MKPIIRTDNLWFRYEKKWVLKNINLEIFEKELVAIIGQNGCGKTTLVKHFNGLLKPSKGVVSVNGIDTRNASTAQLAKIIGYVFQYPDSQIFARSIFEEVSFGPKNLGLTREEIERAVHLSLERVNLRKNRNLPPFSLSTGEKERLAIADILAMSPKVLILDEPTSGQDYSTCENVMKIAREYVDAGNTVIIISHDMDLISEWSDRVLVMCEGRIVGDGRPKEIFSNFELLHSVDLCPPQVSLLAKSLNLKEIPVTVDEMVRIILDGVTL